MGNAYLLCRISDTIEDEEALSPSQKREFSDRWIGVVEGSKDAHEFAQDLSGLLTLSATQYEHDLIINTPRVTRITQSFSTSQQQILQRCVNIMADGMAVFQEGAGLKGLNDLEQFNSYCYHVAGVVGENADRTVLRLFRRDRCTKKSSLCAIVLVWPRSPNDQHP